MSRRNKKDWWSASNIYDFTDKERSVNDYIRYMLCRTQSMFKYNGLPESIPQKYLELYLQMNGSCAIAHVDGSLYALEGGLGGEPDAYYMPTIYTVANSALKLSKTYKINEDCIVITNDSMYQGLLPMMRKYATQLMENDISMNMVDINSRIQALIAAGDERTKQEADKYLRDVVDGKLGAIHENSFLEGIKTQPYGTASGNNSITNLIEYHQYLKASWFNELGLQSNYNMKRESINSNESQLNEDMLYPLIDDMLKCRREGVERVNEMFGTDITVELDSSWKDNKVELQMELENVDNDTDSIDLGVNLPSDNSLSNDEEIISDQEDSSPLEINEEIKEDVLEIVEDIIEEILPETEEEEEIDDETE